VELKGANVKREGGGGGGVNTSGWRVGSS